jgi:uncharacterized membrane protein
MAAIRVLLAGESWMTTGTHFKGWDYFTSAGYGTGTEHLQKALAVDGFSFEHMPSHLAAAHFPNTSEALAAYDVILLSDIGANTLLLHPDTWEKGLPTPNRLKLLKHWVEGGGALGMCGGYLSFAGINAAAKYYRTAIEDILPVNIHTFDDRVEVPEGAIAQVTAPDHPILQGVTGDWLPLLGYNELMLKPDAELLARISGTDHPLLAVRSVGQGRTLIWASDIGPHWCPEPFLNWEGYGRIWQQAIRWMARAI